MCKSNGRKKLRVLTKFILRCIVLIQVVLGGKNDPLSYVPSLPSSQSIPPFSIDEDSYLNMFYRFLKEHNSRYVTCFSEVFGECAHHEHTSKESFMICFTRHMKDCPIKGGNDRN